MISDQPPSTHRLASPAVARSLAIGRRAVLSTLVCLGGLLALGAAGAQAAPFIQGFTPTTVASTVPANGDVNPYGIATVPRSVGALHQGDVLVSNFNNNVNLPAGEQGRGTTIVQIPPGNPPAVAPVFAQINANDLPGPCPGGVGLTTALTVTRSGFVIVGSLPTSDGTAKTAQAGCLLVLNSSGKVVETIAGGPINGPWDMTAVDHGFFTTLYVTNVLNGTVAATKKTGDFNDPGPIVHRGTVVRIQLLTIPGIRPIVFDEDVIATGFPEQTDPNALVIGPTGDALGRDGTLYVADTIDSQIDAIPDAPFRFFPATAGEQVVSSSPLLKGPLGMTLAPNGDILTANGGDGNIVETTPDGSQSTAVTADPAGAGVLFGLTLTPDHRGVYFVDDGTNTLDLLAAP